MHYTVPPALLLVAHAGQGHSGKCYHLLHMCPEQALQPTTSLLQPLPMPGRPWSHISLDFITGLPPLAGNTTILTTVHQFSKAAHFIALPELPTALETAQLLTTRVLASWHPRGHRVLSWTSVYFLCMEEILLHPGGKG